MKEYTPSGKTPEELAAEIKKLEEESENMTEWPDVDNHDARAPWFLFAHF